MTQNNSISMKTVVERWRPIPGFEGLYLASNIGRIKSTDRTDSRNHKRMSFILQPVVVIGYLCVSLYKNSNKSLQKVHRLVAATFHPNPLKKPCVNHKDGNKLNNEVENLEWVTYSENSTHAVENNLLKLKGENNHKSKFSLTEVAEIRQYYATNRPTFQQLATRYGVRKSTVHKIINNKSYK